MTEKMKGREVIFEFQPMGAIMRVTAMDTKTMTEVILQCPINAGERVFQANALKKLEYMLRKKGIIE